MDARPYQGPSFGPKRTGSQVLGDFADNTTIAGIYYIRHASHTFHKVGWTVTFLAFLSVAVWQVYGVTNKYLEFPTNTELTFEQAALKFPSVTICNINPIRASKLELNPPLKQFVDSIQEQYGGVEEPTGAGEGFQEGEFSTYDFGTFGFYDYGSYSSEAVFGGAVDESSKIETNFQKLLGDIDVETRKIMGHPKELSILKCTFNGRQCFPDNFTLNVNKDYGNCFTFNSHRMSNQSFKTKLTGASHGLMVQLFKGDREYLSYVTEGEGYRVVIHPYGTIPFPKEDGVSIAPGRETSIALTYQNITRVGGRYGECEDKLEGYNSTYTKATCENMCADRLIFNECECWLSSRVEHYPESVRNTLSSCTTHDERTCANKILDDVTAQKRNCPCLKACHVEHFNKVISENSWPDTSLWNNLMQRLCSLDLEDNFCSYFLNLNISQEEQYLRKVVLDTDWMTLRVYLSDLTYEQINVTPAYTWPNYLADIGGSVGLWLGLSLFSFMELINLMYQGCRRACFCYGPQPTQTVTPFYPYGAQMMQIEQYPNGGLPTISNGHGSRNGLGAF